MAKPNLAKMRKQAAAVKAATPAERKKLAAGAKKTAAQRAKNPAADKKAAKRAKATQAKVQKALFKKNGQPRGPSARSPKGTVKIAGGHARVTSGEDG